MLTEDSAQHCKMVDQNEKNVKRKQIKLTLNNTMFVKECLCKKHFES